MEDYVQLRNQPCGKVKLSIIRAINDIAMKTEYKSNLADITEVLVQQFNEQMDSLH